MKGAALIGRTQSLTVRTPEGVSFSFPLAGPVTRFLALSIDLICIAGLMIVLNMLLRAFQMITPDFAGAVLMLGYFFISIGYAITFEWLWRGQTVGKRIMRIRVMDIQGLRLHLSQIIVRNLMRFIDSLPMLYLVGGTACALSKYAQRLGDMAANTVVVRMPRIREPDLDRLMPGKFNSLREYPHLTARLRQRVSPREASIALRALMRREDLTSEARVELFEYLANHFRAMVAFPESCTEGLSDEQFVTNISDILFRDKGHQPTPRRDRR